MSLASSDQTVPSVDYLALYRSKAVKSNALIWSVSLSLIVAWLSIVEPGHTELGDSIETYTKEVGKRRDQYRAVQHDRTRLPDILQSTVDLRSAAFEDNNLKQQQKEDNTLELVKSMRKNVSFGAFGATFSIPRKIAAVLWMALLVWTLAFIVSKREELSKLLCKSVRRYLPADTPNGTDGETVSKPKGQLADLAGEAPFWIAPIPASARALKIELKEALGWDEGTYSQNLKISAAIAFGFVIVAARVVYVGFMFTDESSLVSLLTGVDGFTRWSVNLILVGLLLISIYYSARWLIPPIRASDRSATSDKRREILFVGGLVALWSGATFVLGRAIGWNVDEQLPTWKPPTAGNILGALKNPRTAPRKSSAVDVSRYVGVQRAGFYDLTIKGSAPTRTQVVYVDELKRTILPGGLWKMSPGSKPLDQLEFSPTRKSSRQLADLVTRRDGAFAFEQAALSMLGSGGIESAPRAIEILEAAVSREVVYDRPFSHGEPSSRLFDLLATLYARRGENEKLHALATKIEALANRQPPMPGRSLGKEALLARTARWRDPHSKWNRDRRSPSTRIVWRWTDRLKNRNDIEIELV
ncbi:hypothetical protein HFO50_36005 [Rhizobium leguminosarum]|uniref:hypothetical protein n=1 Tax=Rhizobium leguminosarum TaxID=384 RepID=UPI001C98B77C|nr:hypothetical protein [Rhizobium leguminosarum]MBY5606429.1 hypothetical protein [Rhizobium leguminosarum]